MKQRLCPLLCRVLSALSRQGSTRAALAPAGAGEHGEAAGSLLGPSGKQRYL